MDEHCVAYSHGTRFRGGVWAGAGGEDCWTGRGALIGDEMSILVAVPVLRDRRSPIRDGTG